MREMKRAVTFVVLVVLVFAVTACGGTPDNEGAGQQQDHLTATVGTWKTAQTIQPFFYQSETADGLEVEVLPFTNPGDQKTALLAGSLDMCGTTLVTAIMAAANNEPIVIVSGLCNKCSALVAGVDSGIESGADLKGKSIAYVPGTMHHILLLDVLRQNGLDPDEDVTLKRIDFFDMGTALAGGEIDAFCSGEPYPTIAQLEGYGKILDYPYFDESVGTINAAMITTRDKVENDPELVQSLVNAHVNATNMLMENTDAWLDKAEEFGTERATLEASLHNMELFSDIDDEFMTHTYNLAVEMQALGLIDEVPDIEGMFDLSFLNNAMQ